MGRPRAFPLLVAGLLLAGCAPLPGPQPVPSVPPAQPTFASAPSSATPTLEPALSPAPTAAPFFSEVDFALAPDPADLGRGFPPGPRQVFASGAREVFALWTYSGMRPGLVIRRDWDRDGVPWLARQEPWDFDRYGDHGTVTDVSVYDRDYGLLPGVYDLRLSIDGFLTSQGRFVIAAWGTESARSPDGRRLARVRPPGTLVVQDLPGEPHAFEVSGEIADLAWFPDSRHIAFSEVDRSAEIPNSGGVGRGYRLWLFDPETERKTLLAGGGLALHQPFPSPDGRFLAALDGSGWGDACMYDLGLVILRLSASLQPNEVFRLEDFTGIPEIAPDDLAAIYPYDVFWTGAAELQAGLVPICLQDLTPGVYRLDVNARRVIDAPSAPTPGRSPPASASPTTGPTPTGTPSPP